MGRRIYLLIVTAIAVVGLAPAIPAASAQDDEPAPFPVSKGERPLVLPKAQSKAEPAEGAPEPFPAETPAHLGPEPQKPEPAPEETKAPAVPLPKFLKKAITKPATTGDPLPVPTELPAAAPVKEPEPLTDPETVRAQAPATPPASDGSKLPAAAVLPGQPAPAPATSAREGDPEFVLPADRLPIGRQNIGLTVDVIAPQAMNIGQSATLKVVVKNSGSTDAQGVVVRDQLPAGLTFVSSQPETQPIGGNLLTWALGTVTAGSERVITVSVKPTERGAFEHSATVIMKAGGRSRTMVREPKLKLELLPATNKVLLKQPVDFKIAITNIGDGPARQVVVRAKLSPGLRHESGEPNEQNLFEQEPIEVINPGERLVVASLVTDALQGGEQTCQVVVVSPDVVEGAPEATGLATVTVVEPKLAMKLVGQEERFTDTLGNYEITLENPGTAPAKNVKVIALVPVSGRLYALPAGARWDAETRKLTWTRTQLDPGEKAVLSFDVRMGGIGLYQIAVEARADAGLLAKDTKSTNVSGLADLLIDASATRPVVDVGEIVTYRIKVVNKGTKEATGMNLSVKLTDNVEAKQIYGTDQKAQPGTDPGVWIFPQIPRILPGKMIELGVQVRAVKPGSAVCKVFLTHDDLKDDKEKLEDFAHFKVTVPVRR